MYEGLKNNDNWSITYDLYEWILNNLEVGKTILELGSGSGTKYLCDNYNVFSIEENFDYLNIYHQQYIYAPIKNEWYDINLNELPSNIDLFLIDGPAYGKRDKLIHQIEIFEKLNFKILLFDDVNREEDMNGYLDILNYLKSKYNTETGIIRSAKHFAHIKILNKNEKTTD